MLEVDPSVSVVGFLAQ